MMRTTLGLVLGIWVVIMMSCQSAKREADPVSDLLKERPRPDFSMPDSSKMKTFPSGLQIYMCQEGPGAFPQAGSVMRMHYKLKVKGGAVVDDTWERNEPFAFIVSRTPLIPGMEEAVKRLRVGSHAVLIIPPALGYTDEKRPKNIPANSTLIYEVAMLGNI